MTAQPTDRDRATAADIVADWSLHFGPDDLDPLRAMIETYLAAEREAALRPVRELAERYDRMSEETWRQQRAAISYDFDIIAIQIRAACNGQGDGADGPGRPRTARQPPTGLTDITPAPERTAQGE